MASLWPELPPSKFTTTIDHVSEDLLQNIVARLPAASFASAACVSRSWNLVCDHVLCRPKLSSACSLNPSLHVAIEGMVNKVLSEPIRPHFAIAYVGPLFDLQEAHQLITAKLGSKVPLVTNRPAGVIGRYASYDELKETRWKLNDINGSYGDDDDDHDEEEDAYDDESATRAIMLIVGFLPGIKVTAIPLVKQTGEYKFVTDVREFSTSISGLWTDVHVKAVMELMDYFMSPETVIVGDCFSRFHYTSGSSRNITVTGEYVSAVALVFVMIRNKPLGIGETQFDAVLSSGLLPVGSAYAAFVKRSKPHSAQLTARREGSDEMLFDGRMFSPAYDEEEEDVYRRPVLHWFSLYRSNKKKKILRKVGWGTSLAFHKVLKYSRKILEVGCPDGIETGDTFRFYQPVSTTALTSISNVSNHLRSFKQGSTTYKREVFGGLMFTSRKRGESFFVQPNVDSSPFLDNFPGVTFGGAFCHGVFGRGDLNPCEKESQEEKLVHCRAHDYGVVYLIMSYTQ